MRYQLVYMSAAPGEIWPCDMSSNTGDSGGSITILTARRAESSDTGCPELVPCSSMQRAAPLRFSNRGFDFADIGT